MAGFDGSVSCWIPDVPTGRADEQRLRIAQFGDGYTQRTLDGINTLQVKWSVTFNNRENTVINAMVAYLIARKGSSFSYYEKQTATMHNVWCDSWSIDWSIRRRNVQNGVGLAPRYYGTLTAEFVKAYGVTA